MSKIRMTRWIALFLMTVTISTETPTGQLFWGIFGPIDVSTQTATAAQVSGPVILKSSSSPDCYELNVYPNGTPYTTWVPCP